uniref:Cas1_AcylT domain-containing protein n=1 Tax=Heterorhabditis bacteriophora TaxID=37862 RepID=A0A1I7XT38_HETBA
MPAKMSPKLDLFINKGVEYHPLSVFMDVFLWTNLTDQDTYELYQGANCTAVINEYSHDNSLFGLLKSVSIWKSHQLNPFNDTVIGISTYLPYRVSIKTWRVNYIRASMFVGGIVLFLFAKNLVRNSVFYYTSGCTFGILASLLLFVFVIYRIAPKVAVLLISLAVCYKRGPPTDSRSHDIAQWTLQLIALTLIYFSAQVS